MSYNPVLDGPITWVDYAFFGFCIFVAIAAIAVAASNATKH